MPLPCHFTTLRGLPVPITTGLWVNLFAGWHKPAKIFIAGLVAGLVAGCSTLNYARNEIAPQPGDSVEFVSGTSAAVQIDFNNKSAGELNYANVMGKDKCAIFGKSSAVLQSIDPRGDNRMRASYLCQ